MQTRKKVNKITHVINVNVFHFMENWYKITASPRHDHCTSPTKPPLNHLTLQMVSHLADMYSSVLTQRI